MNDSRMPGAARAVRTPTSFDNAAAERECSADLTTVADFAIQLRPARTKDKAALEAFFARVSPDDIYFRFLARLPKVDEERISVMASIDDPHSIDFLALSPISGEILASGTLVADKSFDTA
jgi:hypothetical protein